MIKKSYLDFFDKFKKENLKEVVFFNSPKISEVLTLDDFFNCIENNHLNKNNLIISKSGEKLDFKNFIESKSSGFEKYNIKTGKIYDVLKKGGQVSVYNINKFVPKLNNFINFLEYKLDRTVKANAYYSLESTYGRHPHSDDSDVFTIQLYGKRQWEAYSNNDYPTINFKNINFSENQEIILNKIISKNDVIYMPRGVKHFATGVKDNPSFSIAIVVENYTILDYLDWLTKNRLIENKNFRKDIVKKDNHNYFIEDIDSLSEIYVKNYFTNFIGDFVNEKRINLPLIPTLHKNLSNKFGESKNVYFLGRRKPNLLELNKTEFYFILNQKKYIFNKKYKPAITNLINNRIIEINFLKQKYKEQIVDLEKLFSSLKENHIVEFLK
jgi:hypothetical protein